MTDREIKVFEDLIEEAQEYIDYGWDRDDESEHLREIMNEARKVIKEAKFVVTH